MIYPQSEFRPHEQKHDDVQRIKLNKNYIWPLGILRGFIIVNFNRIYFYIKNQYSVFGYCNTIKTVKHIFNPSRQKGICFERMLYYIFKVVLR